MLAILGGTGLYTLDEIDRHAVLEVETPFGKPSGKIIKGRWEKHEVLFLARHGDNHRLLPHEINYRANIYALKHCGATQVLGLSAVGSLAAAIKPGDFVLPDQYFDWTRGKRLHTFFGSGIAAHVSTARPVSSNLLDWVSAGASQNGLNIHQGVTYACVEGPRLGTKAESRFLQGAGCDVVGMTNVPEAFLAREAQICYASLGIVTDYDCWMENPDMHVKATEIFEQYGKSIAKARQLLSKLMCETLPIEETEIRKALSVSVLTPQEALLGEQGAWFEVLCR